MSIRLTPIQYWIMSNPKSVLTHSLVGLIAHPKTRRKGITLATWSARNVAYPMAVASTKVAANATRAAAPFIARASVTLASGYGLGVVFGVGLSNAFFGDEGREAALDLYSSPYHGFWKKGIIQGPDNLRTVIESL
ncbi:MAG: hypothetical protein [Circular genetic element sp.]|nr:MAG: hypothetical protein [Circular genetic element sp.]